MSRTSEQLDGLTEQRMRSIQANINRAIDLQELQAALGRMEMLGLPKHIGKHIYTTAESLRAMMSQSNTNLNTKK